MSENANGLHSRLDREDENALALVWSAGERGDTSAESVCERHPHVRAALSKLVDSGGIAQSGGERHFTVEGRERAERLARRNRLAEVLLEQVLEVSPEGTAFTACLWEHMLTQEVTDNICTFLGHPRQCPHGKPIPPGECCSRMSRTVTPIVEPLTQLRIGGRGRITFIAPRVHRRLDRLAALGIVPGTELVLHQKSPSYVLLAGETEVAIEADVAADIFVREVSPT